MISVVIPTLNAEASLGSTLAALVPAAVDGFVREVIIADGGSDDRTRKIADAAGAVVLRAERGRGPQLMAGAAAARFPWILFLHADAVLESGWEREAAYFIREVDEGRQQPSAASFRFSLDDRAYAARCVEALVALRCTLFRFPYGDQGLLIPRRLYDEVGGYEPIPVMEDVSLVHRLGRRRMAMLPARVTTSAERYRRDGYLRRIARNQVCLALYFLNVSAERIASVYGQRQTMP